jgi:hypothetical protein
VADGATNTAGIVKLSDATDSTLNAATGKTAATPAAVKAAYDVATAAAADAASRATGSHGHGNITNAGALATASAVVVTDANKKIVASTSITTTELGYLDGVTSNIQNQLNGKAASSHGTHVTYGGNGSATTVSRSDHSHTAHEARTTTIESNYVRFNSTDSKLYIGTSGADEIIFDCGGAPIDGGTYAMRCVTPTASAGSDAIFELPNAEAGDLTGVEINGQPVAPADYFTI